MQYNLSPIQSVARAIAILKLFTQDKPERGVNELSRELDLHKSTVSRLITTLEQGGLLSRNPENGRYRLGVELIGMAANVVSFLDVREVSQSSLRQLANTCQETVNLAVLESGQVINVERFVPSAREVMNVGWVGRHMYPHCTAAGKILLAHLPSAELNQLLQGGLPRFTPRTITNPDRLHRELTVARRRGYATAEEELEVGLNVVAAPIYDHSGRVTAAVSVAGPAYRMPPELFPQLASQLVDATARISEQLGYKKLA